MQKISILFIVIGIFNAGLAVEVSIDNDLIKDDVEIRKNSISNEVKVINASMNDIYKGDSGEIRVLKYTAVVSDSEATPQVSLTSENYQEIDEYEETDEQEIPELFEGGVIIDDDVEVMKDSLKTLEHLKFSIPDITPDSGIERLRALENESRHIAYNSAKGINLSLALIVLLVAVLLMK